MKIRTDFVTNSSSSSATEVMIDNPLLLEILQRYKDLGAFGEDENAFHVKIGSGNFFDDFNPEGPYVASEEKSGFSNTPAVYRRSEDTGFSPPTSLDDVINSIIELIDFEFPNLKMDIDLISKLKIELLQRKDEIREGYLKIFWELWNCTNGHEYQIDGDVEYTWTFTYDRKNGEKSKYVAKNSDTYEILEER